MFISLQLQQADKTSLSKTAAALARRFKADAIYVHSGGILLYQKEVILFGGNRKTFLNQVSQFAAVKYNGLSNKDGVALFRVEARTGNPNKVFAWFKKSFPGGMFVLRHIEVRAFSPDEIRALNPRHKAHKDPLRKFAVSSFSLSKEFCCEKEKR